MKLDPLIAELVISSAAAFVFLGSLLGLAVGTGLAARSAATFRFFRTMNRWVSTRQALKPLEIPRDTAPAAARGGRWLGAALVALGAYAAFALSSVRGSAVAAALAAGGHGALVEIGIETARWFLVLGGVAGAAAGIMLLFFPAAWHAVEVRANRWHSTRRLASAGDTVHLPLDRVAEAFPRATGSVIFVLSTVSAIGSGLLLFSRP